MNLKPGKLDIPALSLAYAQAGKDLCLAGAQLERAGRMLDAGKLQLAEVAIQAGLDRLTQAMKEIPRA